MCHPLVRFKIMRIHSAQVSSLSHNHKLGSVREFENNPNPGLIRNSHRARRNVCPRDDHVFGNFEAIFA